MTTIKTLTDEFFRAYAHSGMKTVYRDEIPEDMLAGPVNSEGWVEWKLTPGTLDVDDYRQLEKEFNIRLPESFITWHRSFYFLDCDCSIVQLPSSWPTEPLREVRQNLVWNPDLLSRGLVPFGWEANDTGPLVFDTRRRLNPNEYPVKVYHLDDDVDGLSEVIFSSFDKLLQCMTHFLKMEGIKKDFETIPDFFLIDSEGAGTKAGRAYWNSWVRMLKANAEAFGDEH